MNASEQAEQRVVRAPVHRVAGETVTPAFDEIAVEEPLEIRLVYGPADARTRRRLSVTMRTPGHDEELATGFLLAEGLLHVAGDCRVFRSRSDASGGDVLTVELAEHVTFRPDRLERQFYTTSSCGVCGKTSLEALRMAACSDLPKDRPRLEAALIHRLPERVRREQSVFEQTGGLHAAALFDAEGRLLVLREDVGRHNAVDKVFGHAAREGRLPFHDGVLFVSGRMSFELVQKAILAGAPVMAAVGAPSSLAIRLARAFGVTLLGFVREGRYNVYSAPWRIRGCLSGDGGVLAHAAASPS